MKRRIAMISDCASPLAGSCDSSPAGEQTATQQSVYVAETVKNLAARGCEIDVFTRCDNPNQQEIFAWLDGVRVVHVPAGPPSAVRRADLLKLMPQFTSFMIRFFKHSPYDLVHANFFLSGLVALNLKRTTETPFVITFHELGREYGEPKNAGEFDDSQFEIEERIVREAAFIFAKTQTEKINLMYSYDAMPEKIQLVAIENENPNWQAVASQIAEVYERAIPANPSLGQTARLALQNLRHNATGELPRPAAVKFDYLTDAGNVANLM